MVLRIEGLRKAFGQLKTTDDVSLSVAAGEIHAIIGPNGAGKTTLIGQIAGEIRPDAGRIYLMGSDVTALSTARRVQSGLARSFQITTLIADISVVENMMLPLLRKRGHAFRIRQNLRSNDSLFSEAQRHLLRAGYRGDPERRVSDLSYGEQRLLELAMALALEPKIILLDEPMAGLGHTECQSMLETLMSLKGSVGMLFVEHDMKAVFALADRVTVLVCGRTIASDTPEAIRQDADVRKAYLGDR